MTAVSIKLNHMAFAVDVAIFNSSGQILLGKRIGSAGDGTWCFPGGHILDDEEILVAARREVEEEVGKGIQVNILNQIIAIRDNSLAPQFVRHITIIVKGEYVAGEPIVNEPDKCEKWSWFDLDKLPVSLFPGTADILSNFIHQKIAIV